MSGSRAGYHPYDVVIIGSGIGGLTAGAYLARDGAKVMICERARRPGGYFTSFKRKGYTFDGGIQGCEDTGILLPMLRELDLLDRIELRYSKLAYGFPDFFCPLQRIDDLGHFYGHLKKVFPHESRALDRIRMEAISFCRVMEALAKAPNPLFVSPWETILRAPGWLLKHASGLKGIRRFSELLDTPVDEYLATFVKDRKLIRFLSVGNRGNPAAFSMSFAYAMMDYYYPAAGGMQAIPDLLARSILEKGGEIRCGTPVERILVERGKAFGVELQGGETLYAPFTVNNGDLRRTFTQMVPPNEVPGEYLRRLQQTDPGESVFSVYLGVDIPADEIPTHGCGHILHMPTYDTVDVAEIHSNPDFYGRALMMLMVPTLHDRALAPKGKSVVILQCAASMRSLDQWGRQNGKRTKKYEALKKEIANRLIRNAEQIIPGLSKRIELQIESTPFTLRRHTLNSAGASVGWTAHPRETFTGGLKGLVGSSNTPIKNLYQVGHWTSPPGGAPAGLMTGKILSTVLRHRLRWGV